MKLKPIINSLLETDLYKFSMRQVISHQFNKDRTNWAFRCRNKNVRFTPEMVREIKEQLDHYCTLRFTKEELDWLRDHLPWLSEDFIADLRQWKPWRDEILVNDASNIVDPDYDCGLTIEARGRWVDTSMYEIPILAIVNEVYFAFTYGKDVLLEHMKKNTDRKIKSLVAGELRIGTFSEFGLRRRYSAKFQDWLIRKLKESNPFLPGSFFVGTSNVFLAKKYGVKPVGTMAHEMIQGMQGHHEYNPAYSNLLVMKAWEKEFGVDNGIFLTDCITTDCFLRDFNKRFATLFSGVRHDSGDPYDWGEKMLAHYRKLGIDPSTKTLLFSDSLDFNKANAICTHFSNRTNVAFGIGTFLANDPSGLVIAGKKVEPLNIVFKMVESNGSPVCKISDAAGKCMCRDTEYVDYLRRCIDWRLSHEKAV